MRATVKAIIAAAALSGAGALPAQAGGIGAGLYGMMDACREEHSRYCPDVEPGDGGRLVQCMATFKNELNPRCYRAFSIASAMRACEADYRRLCRDVPPGAAGALRCLAVNGPDVSEFCRRAIQTAAPGFGERNVAAGGYGEEEYRGEPVYGRQENGLRDGQRYGEPRDGRSYGSEPDCDRYVPNRAHGGRPYEEDYARREPGRPPYPGPAGEPSLK